MEMCLHNRAFTRHMGDDSNHGSTADDALSRIMAVLPQNLAL